MYENACCFEPTFTLNGIPILPGRFQALSAQGKAEAPVAVTHLALARSQKMGGGILGDTKDKETIICMIHLFFENWIHWTTSLRKACLLDRFLERIH